MCNLDKTAVGGRFEDPPKDGIIWWGSITNPANEGSSSCSRIV